MTGIFEVGSAVAGALLPELCDGAHAQNATITDAIGAGKLILEERLRSRTSIRPHSCATRGPDPAHAPRLGDRRLGEPEGRRGIRGRPPPQRAPLQHHPQRQDPVPHGRRSGRHRNWTASSSPGTPVQQVSATGRTPEDQPRRSAFHRPGQLAAGRPDLRRGRIDGSYGRLKDLRLPQQDHRTWPERGLELQQHAVAGYYALSDALKGEAFVYALDLHQAPALSTETVGGPDHRSKPGCRFYQLSYAASYADQRNYGLNPAHYHVPY